MRRLFVIVASIFIACSTPPPQPPFPQSEPPQFIGGYVTIYDNLAKPDEAEESGTEGEVVIKAFIDSTGTVTETVVVLGLPNTGLDEAAIEAVRKTSWKPARQGGYSVGVWIEIPVVFRGFFQPIPKLEHVPLENENANPFPVPIGGYRAMQKNIVYPEWAQIEGIEGTVEIHVLVYSTGKVIATRVLKGAHPLLDNAASEAVKRTRFQPAQIGGEPVAMWISFPINFRLRSYFYYPK